MLSSAPIALFADTIEARSKVTGVTIFPWGAQVTREVTVAAGEGQHDLVIPDLPANTDASSLRLAGDVKFGAVSLATSRQAATADLTDPAIKDARDEVARLQDALDTKRAAISAIRLKIRAAEEEIAFLRGMTLGAGASPETLRETAKIVGEQVLIAATSGHAAEQEAKAAEADLQPDIDALERAKKALSALQNPTDTATLSARVEGSGTLTITTFTGDAHWRPTYDLRLDREAKDLTVERSVLVSQSSGEDWSGVDLVLSTARPNERATPSEIWPRLVQAGDPVVYQPMARAKADLAGAEMMESFAAAPIAQEMSVDVQGQTVVYRYANPVDLRDGVEDVRLSLGELTLPATIRAEAVPIADQTAYLMASAVNTGEILLPGDAVLYEDGALKGTMQLPLVAAGDEIHAGFGAIEGIKVKRVEPETMEGGRGFLTKSNSRYELAVITVEVLPRVEETWPLRVVDRVPYSEQETLKITSTASPAPSEKDLDDKRGVWAWDMDVAPGSTTEIRIESDLSWPEGKVLN
jgi:uncharacterized protein (TIGR02231 family)